MKGENYLYINYLTKLSDDTCVHVCECGYSLVSFHSILKGFLHYLFWEVLQAITSPKFCHRMSTLFSPLEG